METVFLATLVVCTVSLFEGIGCQTYIGCFRNSPVENNLNGVVDVLPTNSPDMCIQYCAVRNYLYAGVGQQVLCYCGNRFESEEAVASSECNMKCLGINADKTCGGEMAVQVYRIEADICDPNPCQNGGVCSITADSYTCECSAEFSGDHCDQEVDICDPNPCQNSGVCSITADSYTCECSLEFSGDHCEQVVECPGKTTKKRCSSTKKGYSECEVPTEKTILGIYVLKDLSGSTGCEFHPNPAPADEDYVNGMKGVYGFFDNVAWVTWGCKGRLEICYI